MYYWVQTGSNRRYFLSFVFLSLNKVATIVHVHTPEYCILYGEPVPFPPLDGRYCSAYLRNIFHC